MWKRAIQFELFEMLGEGGQGSVYKALRRDRATGLKQTVAVKILHSKTAVELWQREFESLSRVRSKYCVRALSFERVGRRPALVLEYIDGISLARLGSSCALDARDAHEIAAQLEYALKDLHSFGVFHGDLSPQNILIDLDGGVRLLDFGLANSAPGLVRLTPEFAAPERLRGEPVNAATDLFSLGRVIAFAQGTQNASHPYCALEPGARSFGDLKPNPAAQHRLAQKIREHRRRMTNLASQQTLTQSWATKKRWPVTMYIVGAAASLFMLATSGAAQDPRYGPMAVLSVRTERWHYFLLDGQPVGYPPFSIPLTANRTHRLQWLSAHSHGTKEILLPTNESRLLQDRDFSH
jgi:serine/threonine protein kinase